MLPENFSGGPHGLGDPDDRSLRKCEREIMIPQKMKEIAKKEQCADTVRDFGICAKEQGLMMPFRCRQESEQMRICLADTYADQEFVKRCTDEYLQERSEYRRTGITKKHRNLAGSM